jgi:hypothetical protein
LFLNEGGRKGERIAGRKGEREGVKKREEKKKKNLSFWSANKI